VVAAAALALLSALPDGGTELSPVLLGSVGLSLPVLVLTCLPVVRVRGTRGARA
jgi:hypothetical protein